jgi:hypothetical protein
MSWARARGRVVRRTRARVCGEGGKRLFLVVIRRAIVGERYEALLSLEPGECERVAGG